MGQERKRPRRLRKAVLTALAIYSGTAAAGCRPVVCDPAPPPSLTPKLTPEPSATPMICDPAPPPTWTPGPSETPLAGTPIAPAPPTPRPPKTPMICDPAPWPSPADTGIIPPTRPVAGQRQFSCRQLRVFSDPSLQGAEVQGVVVDAQSQPLAGLAITVRAAGLQLSALSGADGRFTLPLPSPGTYRLSVAGDEGHALSLTLGAHERAAVEWMEVEPEARVPLPLAEIRAVEIVRYGELTFGVRTRWPGARYRWSASGGTLNGTGEQVTWQRPAEPGRYLLQVVADWGATGVAVDALVLAMAEDGRVTVSR